MTTRVIKKLQRKFSSFHASGWSEYKQLTDLVRNYDGNGAKAPDVLVFGDSVMERVADEDSDRRTLYEMIRNFLQPAYRCSCVSYSAYNPKIYVEFAKAQEKMEHHPKIVILPVNIRCFSPQWDLRPQWQHEAEIHLIHEYIENPQNKIGRIFRNPPDDTLSDPVDAFRNLEVAYPLTDFKTIGQFLDEVSSEPADEEKRNLRKKLIFIFHYMHPLRVGHRQVNDLREMLRIFQKMNITVLMYLTPINIKAGEKYVGEEFTRQVVENVKILSGLNEVNDNHIHFRNWIAEFSPEYFFDRDLATEHLNQQGRQQLAERIASELTQIGYA